MSFCLRPNVCKKCGKPLTLFEGWTCLECEKVEQESILDKIRAEIVEEQNCWREDTDAEWYECRRILRIIDKYKGDKA